MPTLFSLLLLRPVAFFSFSSVCSQFPVFGPLIISYVSHHHYRLMCHPSLLKSYEGCFRYFSAPKKPLRHLLPSRPSRPHISLKISRSLLDNSSNTTYSITILLGDEQPPACQRGSLCDVVVHNLSSG